MWLCLWRLHLRITQSWHCWQKESKNQPTKCNKHVWLLVKNVISLLCTKNLAGWKGWGGVWKFFYQQLKLPPNFLWQRCVFLSWRSPFFILSTNLRALKTVLCILSGDNHKFFLGKPKEIAISEGILICVIDLIFFLKCPMLHLTFHLPEKDEVQVLIWSLLKSVVISTGHEAPWDS